MRIFKMNDCEWWRASSLDEAIAAMMKETGMSHAEVLEGDPVELTDEETDAMTFVDSVPDEEEPKAGWPQRSFTEQCRLEDEAGAPAGIFAGTADLM